jgi:hypothetical protein
MAARRIIQPGSVKPIVRVHGDADSFVEAQFDYLNEWEIFEFRQ